MEKSAREKYLNIRPQLLTGIIPEEFLYKWCVEEGRRYDHLLMILNLHASFLVSLVNYFDGKYVVVKVFSPVGELIKVI